MDTAKQYIGRGILEVGKTLRKFLVSGGIILVLLSGVLSAQTEADTVRLDLLIDEALNNNPRLKSFYLASRADSFNIPQTGALPDPMLSFNLLNLPVNTFAFDFQTPCSGEESSGNHHPC